MKPIVVRLEIGRPAQEVFALLEDAEQNPRWLAGMQHCTWTSSPPIGVGSSYDQVARFLRKEIRTSFEVTEHVPGRRISIASRQGSSFPITVTREVEPTGPASSRVTETVLGDPSGFYRLAYPLLRRMVRGRIRRDYRRLRGMLESGRIPSPP